MTEKPFNLRLGPLRAKLQRLADEDQRTLSAYIRMVLSEHVTAATENERTADA